MGDSEEAKFASFKSGYRAAELIAEAASGIQLEVLAEDLAWSLRIHPTLSENLTEAGRLVMGQALYVPKF